MIMDGAEEREALGLCRAETAGDCEAARGVAAAMAGLAAALRAETGATDAYGRQQGRCVRLRRRRLVRLLLRRRRRSGGATRTRIRRRRRKRQKAEGAAAAKKRKAAGAAAPVAASAPMGPGAKQAKKAVSEEEAPHE
jgi:hypothetical protein